MDMYFSTTPLAKALDSISKTTTTMPMPKPTLIISYLITVTTIASHGSSTVLSPVQLLSYLILLPLLLLVVMEVVLFCRQFLMLSSSRKDE